MNSAKQSLIHKYKYKYQKYKHINNNVHKAAVKPTTRQLGRSFNHSFFNLFFSFICRCAEAAKDYNYFAATYFGECWVATDQTKVAGLLQKSTVEGCLNTSYLACQDSTNELCVGQEHFHYIYKSYLPQREYLRFLLHLT